MNKVFLYPGRYAAFAEPTEIATILGSCVSVALFDESTKIGGLNHYLLSEAKGAEGQSGRYASYAIPKLIDEVVQLGANSSRLKAKIYGGAAVLNNVHIGQGVGERNIEVALEMLQDCKIPIIEKNVGGTEGRRISLLTHNFEVSHRLASEIRESHDISGFSQVQLSKKVRVAIVDDSATVRNLFHKIFVKAGLEVVGTAADAFSARELIVKEKPDVITLDIEMPKMSGVAFLDKLMKHMPTPVVMVSSLGSQGDAALKSLELGAIEFVHKPSQFDPNVLKSLAETLVEKVKAAAAVNVLKKRSLSPSISTGATAVKSVKSTSSPMALIVVGGNAGAQNSLKDVLERLHEDTPPVVVANSTISGFLPEYIKNLKPKANISFCIAEAGMFLKQGVIYFAPPDAHVKIGKNMTLEVQKGVPIFGQMPSANVLFESAVAAAGSRVCGVLLSGFGRDGVDGLEKIFESGGMTIAESPNDAKFPFAPQTAIAEGVADAILTSTDITEGIMNYRNRSAA